MAGGSIELAGLTKRFGHHAAVDTINLHVTSGEFFSLLGPAEPGADPAGVVRRYLTARRTDSARALAAKAAILIDPPKRAGEIVWPPAVT